MNDNYENAVVERAMLYNVFLVPYNALYLNILELEAYIHNANVVIFDNNHVFRNAINIWFRSADIAGQGPNQGFMYLFFESEIDYKMIINHELPNYMVHNVKNNGYTYCFKYYF